MDEINDSRKTVIKNYDANHYENNEHILKYYEIINSSYQRLNHILSSSSNKVISGTSATYMTLIILIYGAKVVISPIIIGIIAFFGGLGSLILYIYLSRVGLETSYHRTILGRIEEYIEISEKIRINRNEIVPDEIRNNYVMKFPSNYLSKFHDLTMILYVQFILAFAQFFYGIGMFLLEFSNLKINEIVVLISLSFIVFLIIVLYCDSKINKEK